MQNKLSIKTVQPYKLYGIVKSKLTEKKIKQVIIACIPLVILFIILGICDETFLIIGPVVLLFLSALVIPTWLYDRSLNKYYEPGKSYSWVKELYEDQPPTFYKDLPYLFAICGMLISIGAGLGECLLTTAIFGGLGYILFRCFQKYPEKFKSEKFVSNKARKIREQLHEDIDYNVKVDLNDIYGISDKMSICYQNFHYNQKKLEDGNYLLGVSSQAIYFAYKNGITEKLRITFEEIDSLGVFTSLGLYIFHIKSKAESQINIVIDQGDDFSISALRLFDILLNTLDSFILNDGVVPETTSRRRKVSISPVQDTPALSKVESTESAGRSIELDSSSSNESDVHESSSRVIDIAYTDEVLAELAGASFIESNRKIDL